MQSLDQGNARQVPNRMDRRQLEHMAGDAHPISRFVSKTMDNILDRTRCFRVLRNYWISHIPAPPRTQEDPVSQLTLEAADILLHALCQSVSQGHISGDTRVIPEFLALWPDLWPWVKTLYAQLTLSRPSESSVALATTQSQFSAFTRSFSALVSEGDAISETLAETPGFLTLVISLWMEEWVYAPQTAPFGCADILKMALMHIILQERADIIFDEVIPACGGQPRGLVNASLKHIQCILRQRQINRALLSHEIQVLQIAGGADIFMAPLAASSTCIKVITGALKLSILSRSSKVPEEVVKHDLLMSCDILSQCMGWGGFQRVSEAMDADILRWLLRASIRAPEHSQEFTLILNTLTKYLVYRSICSVTSSSADRIGSEGSHSVLSSENAILKSWTSFKNLLTHRMAQISRYKSQPLTSFICGNPNCREVETANERFFLRCSGCSLLRVCSRRCQKQSWKGFHRRLCHNMQRRQIARPITFSNPDLRFFGHLIAEEIKSNHIAVKQGVDSSAKAGSLPWITINYSSDVVEFDIHPLPSKAIFLSVMRSGFISSTEGLSTGQSKNTGAFADRAYHDEVTNNLYDGMLSGGSDSLIIVVKIMEGGRPHQMTASVRLLEATLGKEENNGLPHMGLSWIYST